MPEQIALANSNISPNNRPLLIEFHGYEGEDFRHFQEVLESYMDINDITKNVRKRTILKAQLRGPAKTLFEKVILKDNPGIEYEQAIANLKARYITPELIQRYELQFNEMYQGEQEHPQIFFARLQEAAGLAEIKDEAVIESRFRAGLLPEIKQFCIQSSSRTTQDWMTHAEGWWYANKPRKISMVNNPFIPRNANQALIEHGMEQHKRHQNNNHNIELYDAEQQPAIIPAYGLTTNQNQLTAMDATPRRAQYSSNTHSHNRNYNQQSNHLSQQQELVDLIQRTIRSELDNQRQQYNRNYGRNNRNNYNNNNYSNDRYGRPNNNYNNRYNSRADDNYNNQQQGSNQNQQPKN